MPNYCNNRLTIRGSKEDLLKFKEDVKVDDNIPLSFEKTVPIGEIDDWYNQRCHEWGTKWDVNTGDTYFFDNSDDDNDRYISYTFDTAWAPPCPWLEKTGKMYPQLSFELTFEEGGCCIYGIAEVVGGEYSDEDMDHHTYLQRFDEDFKECVKEIRQLSQEDLIKYFSGIKNFTDYVEEEEKVEHEPPFNINYDYFSIARVIVDCISFENLPMFMGVDWVDDEATSLFKEKLAAGNLEERN